MSLKWRKYTEIHFLAINFPWRSSTPSISALCSSGLMSPIYLTKSTCLLEDQKRPCRQDLEVGNSYVVMGYVYDGKMYFGQCDWTTRNEDLTEHMIRGLRFKYRRGCNCKIQTCYGDQHCDSLGNQNNTCLWMSSNECDRQFGFCTERPDIGCAWRRNGMRRNCLRGLTNA
ncbi:metalloproteinase inhibitor 3-like isoform X2 [Pecten maximus]|uniref:metalloproteinase inhibitor 3-like isoform X2 n=1 Tax=Pecten maximus TaxID=6579 RepID=UPI0014582FBF|nr:metalloproteinase inhibitor 3-like isoform X2 [Pecten maximus]